MPVAFIVLIGFSAPLFAAPVFTYRQWSSTAKSISRDYNFGSSVEKATEATKAPFSHYEFPENDAFPDAEAAEEFAQSAATQVLGRTDFSVSWTANVEVDSQNGGSTKGTIFHGGYAMANAKVEFDLTVDEDTYADMTFQTLKTPPFLGWPISIKADLQFLAGDSAVSSISHNPLNWGQSTAVVLQLTPGTYRVKADLFSDATPTYGMGGSFGADVGVQYSLVLRPVPEPCTSLLAGLGAGGLALLALRRRSWPRGGAPDADGSNSPPQAHDERPPPDPLGRSAARS